jgi:DNA-binding GntR family transcriptional regulator
MTAALMTSTSVSSAIRRGRSGRTPQQSLLDAAYEAIKHSIITCKFKPGECVNEASISAMLGLGRSSVNKALDRLMLEEMVEVMPRKGVIIRPVLLHEVIELIDARLVNEVHCARLAAERADDDHIEKLGEIVSRARRSLSEGHIQKMMLLDREFHSMLASSTRNPEFRQVLRKFSERSLRFWFISFAKPEQASLQEQHEEILAAVKDHDVGRTETAMRAHIAAIRKFVTRQL